MKQCGLRKAYAAGGVPDQSWMSASQKSMLGDFDKRMASLSQPSVGVHADALGQQQYLEDVNRFNDAERIKSKISDLNGLGGMGLSPRQKASALNTLGEMGAKMGLSIDTGVQDLRGLSGKQRLANDMSSLAQQTAIGDYGLARDKANLTAGLADQRDRRLGFSQGGTVDPDALMREMAAKYGTGGGQPAAPAPVAAPAPAPAPVAQAKPTLLDGLRRIATGGLDERMKKAGFKQGGEVKEGGWIDGPKGVDKVPAKVAETGEDILVSHGERIVNKEQNKALEALAAQHGMGLDEYLEGATGEPVGPSMKKGLRAAENGASFMRVHQTGDRNHVDFNPAPAPNPARLSQGAIRQVEEFQPKEDPEALMQRVAKTRGIEYVPPSAPTVQTAPEAAPTDPDTDGRRAYSPNMASAFNYRGAAKPVLANGGNYSNEGRAVPKPVTATSPSPISTADRSLVDNTLGANAAIPQGLRSRYGAADAMGKTQEYISGDNAAASLRGDPKQGHGVVSIDQGNGKFKNVLMAPPEYTAADGSKTSDWSKTAQYAEGVKRAEADKVALDRIQRERATYDAFDPSITDPNARAAGLRKVGMYMMQDEMSRKAAADAAKIAHDNLQLQLTKRGQDITLRGQENMQGNSDRTFKREQQNDLRKRVDDWLNTAASENVGKDGQPRINAEKRRALENNLYGAFGGNLPTDPQEFNDKFTTLTKQSELSEAINDAVRKSGGFFDYKNWGLRGGTTSKAAVPQWIDGGKRIKVGDTTLDVIDIIKNKDGSIDADKLAMLEQRMPNPFKK